MNCYFHDTLLSVRVCARCRKQLCEDCYHSAYPDYCWGCGLDFDNSLEELEKGMVIPWWLQSAPARYVMVKLAAASGSWIGVTVAGSVVLGLFGVPIGLAAVFLAIFSICVVYTYGMACAVVVDWIGRFAVKMSSVVRAVVYAVLGAAFPWLVNLLSDGSGLFHQPVNTLFGVAAALLFWSVERLREKQSLIIGLATVGTIIPIIVFILVAKGEMNVWSAGMGR